MTALTRRGGALSVLRGCPAAPPTSQPSPTRAHTGDNIIQVNASTVLPLLDVRGVTLQYKTRQYLVAITYRVDFQVYPDEHYILLGPSGCGRSTLLKAIDDYLTPTEGEIRLKGQPVMKLGPDRMMVLQELDQLLPWKTVKESVLFPLLPTDKLGAHEAGERALRYIGKINFIKFVNCHPCMLSGRIRQRVAIARDMAIKPDVLLMDEPFTTFDALTCHKVQDELLQPRNETRSTVLFAAHSIPGMIRCGSHTLIFSPYPDQIRAELLNLAHGDDDPERFEALEARIHDMLFVRVMGEIRAD